jgi:hypothetical protein
MPSLGPKLSEQAGPKQGGIDTPNSIVCDRCIGALPLIFTVAVAGSVTAGTLVVSISVAVRGDHR